MSAQRTKKARTGEVDSSIEFECENSTTVSWVVKKFRTLTAESIQSPTFTEPITKSQWRLTLYPHGFDDTENNKIGLFLTLLSDNPTWMTYELSVIGAGGKKPSFAIKNHRHFFDPGAHTATHGSPNFLNREKTLKGWLVLWKDQLTVNCELKPKTMEQEDNSTSMVCISCPNVSLAEAIQNNCPFDVKLVSGESEIPAHRLILSAMSPVFKAMFENDTREKSEGRVVIEDTTADAVREMVHFIYFGKLSKPATLNEVEKLMFLADKYQIEVFKASCESRLVKHLTIGTATRILALAELHSATRLIPQVHQFIKNNSFKVMTSPDMIATLLSQPVLVAKVFQDMANQP